MISKEDYEKIITDVKSKLSETDSALISEELLALLSAYNNGLEEYNKNTDEIEKLKAEKEELLKVNGKLYQKIGFDKEEKEEIKNEDNVEEIKIEDVINEKGEMI